MTIFNGIRVLEFSPFISGQYCAKLFGDLGAEVIKIEPPGTGDWTRQEGPFPHDEPDAEASGLYLYLNINKQGVTLDPTTPQGRELFLELVRTSDVVIEGHTPGEMGRLELDYEVLRAVNPNVIMASVSPFGQTGPYSEFKAHHLNLFQGGGEGFVMPGGYANDLHPDREPISAPSHVAECDGGVGATIPIAAALIWRELTGEGQFIDVSVQELLLHLSGIEVERWADTGFLEHRGSRNIAGGVMPCKDGFVILDGRGDEMWGRLMKVLGNPEWSRPPEYGDRAWRAQHVPHIREKLMEWTMEHDKEFIYHETQKAGIATAITYTSEDVFRSPQNAARDFFVELDHEHAGRLAYPFIPYRFSEVPIEYRSAAPLLGQHNQQVYGGLLGYSDNQIEALRAASAI